MLKWGFKTCVNSTVLCYYDSFPYKSSTEQLSEIKFLQLILESFGARNGLKSVQSLCKFFTKRILHYSKVVECTQG